jgi:hypothetical protein
MRFEVPQFIEIEDKIIGPLTWKQFVYLAGGSGILLVLFLTMPLVIFAIIGLPIGALSFSLAFHKINNRPFSIFLESFVNYFTNTKLYLWRKEQEQSIVYKEMDETTPASALSYTHKGSLSSLANKLEHHIQDS